MYGSFIYGARGLNNSGIASLVETDTFTSADLDATGQLTVNHSKGRDTLFVWVRDNENSLFIVPVQVTVANTQIKLQLNTGITGTWRYYIW